MAAGYSASERALISEISVARRHFLACIRRKVFLPRKGGNHLRSCCEHPPGLSLAHVNSISDDAVYVLEDLFL
jgi:hypothetical protein